MQKFISNSEAETKKIAAGIAGKKKGNVYALTGELGAGKTIFAQGFARGLGIKEKIISPTFVLIRQHPVPNNNQIFYHVDLYRLENPEIGLSDLWSDPNNILLIEWADKLKKLPKETVKIYMKKAGEEKRLITLS